MEAIDRGTVVERKHTIGGFAVITEYVSTGVFEHAYFLTDHLGSIDTITDQSGAVTERMSFDVVSIDARSGRETASHFP